MQTLTRADPAPPKLLPQKHMRCLQITSRQIQATTAIQPRAKPTSRPRLLQTRLLPQVGSGPSRMLMTSATGTQQGASARGTHTKGLNLETVITASWDPLPLTQSPLRFPHMQALRRPLCNECSAATKTPALPSAGVGVATRSLQQPLHLPLLPLPFPSR